MGAPVHVSAGVRKCENHVPSVLFAPRLEVEATLGVADAFDGGLVHKPTATIACGVVDERAGETRSGAILEDLLHNGLFAATSRDKGDTHGVRDHGQGQCDALGRRLGAVLDGGNPGGSLAQEFVAGEQRAGVAIGAAAEQQEVEDGQTDRITAGKRADEDLLVVIGHL